MGGWAERVVASLVGPGRWLTALVQSAPLAMWSVNRRGEVTLWNRAAERLLGWEAGAVMGRVLDAMPEAITKAAGDEFRLATASGGEVVCQAWSTALPWTGSGSGFLTLAVDVTMRSRRQRALEESEARYRSIYERMTDGHATVDLTGRILEFNDAFQQLTGYPAAELRTLSYQQLTPPQWHEFERKILEQSILAFGMSPLYEKEYRRKDGSTVPVELRTYLLRDESGAPCGYSAVVRDITERKRAEAELRRAREFAQAIESTADGLLVVLDCQGRIVRFNPACERLTGWRADEVVGRCFWKFLIPEEQRAEVCDAFAGLTLGAPGSGQGRSQKRYENDWLTKDGERRWITWSSSVLLDEQGAVEYVIGTGIDITDQRRGDQERLQLEEQLRYAQRLESIGRLAGGVAHDFNNLLTVINGYSELALQRKGMGEPLEQNLREIRSAGERAADLTRQLLVLSCKQDLEPRVLDLNRIVEDSEKMLRRVIGEDVDLQCRLAQELALVSIDPGQLHQVIMHLVSNARDAMPAGGRMTIETANVLLDAGYVAGHPDAQAGPHVMLAVRDEGHGMDPATLERVFEPFFTTKEPGNKGTGLGLATVYAIVRQSGGHVAVDSEVGRGTTFRVYLPVVTVQEPTAAGAAPAVSGGTVLVVEDDPGVRRLIVSALRRGGYQVLEAAGGEAAERLASANAGRIDLLISDLVMPGLRGTEVARRLRRIAPGLRVLFISGYSDVPAMDGADSEPGTSFLGKPFGPEQLVAKVRALLLD